MKRVVVRAGKIGLVFKKGNLKRVLQEGVYWLSMFETIKVYSMAEAFFPDHSISLLLKNDALRAIVHCIKVDDDAICLRFEEGNFKGVLLPGVHVYFKGLVDFEFQIIDLRQTEIDPSLSKSVIKHPALLNYIRVVQVGEHEKALLFLDGEYNRTLGGGDYFFWNNSVSLRILKTDVRHVQMELNGQEILTKDKVALRVNFSATYQVVDIEKALMANKEFEKELYILLQVALREHVGTLSFDELLNEKDKVGERVLSYLSTKLAGLGVEIRRAAIRDIVLPGEVKDIMNKVLIADKQAQANIIARRDESAAIRTMLNSAKIMQENPMLFSLKEMEYTERIAERINSISLSGGARVMDQLREIFIR